MPKAYPIDRSTARQRAAAFGCCGFPDWRYTLEVVDYDEHGSEIDRWSKTKCGLTWEVCQAAQLGPVYQLLSIINRGGAKHVEATSGPT